MTESVIHGIVPTAETDIRALIITSPGSKHEADETTATELGRSKSRVLGAADHARPHRSGAGDRMCGWDL